MHECKTIAFTKCADPKYKNKNRTRSQKNPTITYQPQSYYCEINLLNLRICKTINLHSTYYLFSEILIETLQMQIKC